MAPDAVEVFVTSFMVDAEDGRIVRVPVFDPGDVHVVVPVDGDADVWPVITVLGVILGDVEQAEDDTARRIVVVPVPVCEPLRPGFPFPYLRPAHFAEVPQR